MAGTTTTPKDTNMTEPPDIPYSVARLAAALGVDRRTVLNHIDRGLIHAIKLGPNTGAWVIPADEAARYIATQRDNEAGAA